MKENNDKKQKAGEPAKQDNLQKGQEAIETEKKLFNKHKPEEQKEKDEEKDAETWRNEG